MSSECEVDWEAVRYFLHAAQAKSLSGAARALAVEHTTVGRRIAALERNLGAALIERSPAGLTVTRLGKRVLRHAIEMERLARAIGGLAVIARSQVRLVVPTGFTALLTPHLEALHHAQPSLLLDLVSAGKQVDLRQGEADLAIRVGPIKDDGLVARKLGDAASALYGSRAYLGRRKAVSNLDDLRGHAVIGFHASLSDMPAAQWLEARSQHAQVVLRSREAADMLAATRSGAGLAVLPCFLADADSSLLRLTPEPVASRRVSLVYSKSARLSPELRAVVRFVIRVMQEHADELRGGSARHPRTSAQA